MSDEAELRCYRCKLAAVDTCPMCGTSVCMVCAEREGEFCCDEPSNGIEASKGVPMANVTEDAKESESVSGKGRRVSDYVNHPPYYKANGLEAIDVIEAFGLGFCLGNAIKYILRAGRKGNAREDLEKARWYIDRELAGTAGRGDE